MDKWVKRDLNCIWHPYTQMKDCQSLPPILIERAQGLKLYDNKGRFYYDTISSWWCNVHGHNHPKIKQAIKKQLNSLEHVLFAGFTHKPAILLAEKLVAVTPPGLTRVFFSDNGSTAVEVALKASFQYWQNIGKKKKTKFVSLDCAYHGDTLAAMTVSGESIFNEIFKPLFFPSFKVSSPYCYRCPQGKKRASCKLECLKPLEELLKKHSRQIAALILEPLLAAAGGMIIYPKEYLVKARALTKKYGVHLIADEVATGFGRTGRMFACQHADITPDFMCLSKGITAGYLPLAATLTTQKIYQAFYADYHKKKTFYHGHTYTANPLACSAGLASLKIFQEENTLSRVGELSPLLSDGLSRINRLDHVGDVRSIGLIGAVELVKDKQSKTPFSFRRRVGLEIYQKGLARNLLLRPLGNIIYLFLPLGIKRRELTTILDRCYEVIKGVRP